MAEWPAACLPTSPHVSYMAMCYMSAQDSKSPGKKTTLLCAAANHTRPQEKQPRKGQWRSWQEIPWHMPLLCMELLKPTSYSVSFPESSCLGEGGRWRAVSVVTVSELRKQLLLYVCCV